MDRPRTILGWALRVLAIAACLCVITVLMISAVRLTSGFLSPASGASTGNAGHLIVALFMIILAGPFIALTLAMGLPIVSDNPKFRGADR